MFYTGFTVHLKLILNHNKSVYSLTGCTGLYNYIEIITCEYLHQNVNVSICKPGRVAQSVTCLATDVYMTEDQGVASKIPA